MFINHQKHMKLTTKIKRLFKKTEKEIEKDVSKIGEEIKDIAKADIEFFEYEEKLFAKWGYSIIRKTLGPIIRWLWVSEIEGLENIPKNGPVIIASNHESYFDFLCFTAASPRKIHYMAAEKFFNKAVWKQLMQLTGQIRVDRKHPDKSKVFQQVFSALKQGRMMGIFPEGTRSPDGKLLKAFTGVAKIALQAKVPVVPVGMIGTYEIMSRHDKRPKLKKAKIKIGKPIYFNEYHNIEHKDHHFREVTDKIMLEIAELTGEKYLHAELGEEHIKREIE